jgi:hypothetical protein
VLSLANVVHFSPDEFAGLRGRGLTLSAVFAGATQGFLFRHG